jgi:hypothetical protein
MFLIDRILHRYGAGQPEPGLKFPVFVFENRLAQNRRVFPQFRQNAGQILPKRMRRDHATGQFCQSADFFFLHSV